MAMFAATSAFVPVPLPFERPNVVGPIGAGAGVAVQSLVPSQGPFPYPQTFGPPAPPGAPDHYRVSFGPGPTPLNEGPPIRIKRTNYVMLGNLLIRPYARDNWHNKMRDGQFLWVARNAQVDSELDASQEVRNLTHMNATLRAKGKLAYERLKQRARNNSLTKKEEALLALPEVATANPEFWNVRATDDASKRFFNDYWALSPYGILERYGWPIGVSYISPTVASHFPMPPGVNPLNGPSFSQITVAIKGECNVLNVFPAACNFANLFFVLRRERFPDGKYSEYFQWVPISSFDDIPHVEDLEYSDLAGCSLSRAHYIFVGTVQDQKGLVPVGEALLRAQGRTPEDSMAHYHANMALSAMGVTLKTRHFGFLAPT